MLLRRSQPPNHRLSDPIKPANRVPGPASPLERDPQSPIGWKNRESDGVGLGIVAALDKLDNWKRPEKIKCASAPIPVGDRRSACGWTRGAEGREDDYVWQSDGGVPFYESPPPRVAGEPDGFRMADILSCCYLCRKRLNGKDVYMYRGEKAFCSVECRHQQIVSDEFQENCSSETSNSSYSDNSKQLFFTSIVAA